MPYKDRYRQFLFRVTKKRCQWESYSETKGFKECGKEAIEVHHPIPERVLLRKGYDPEHAVPGLPVCQNHHSRNLKGEIFDNNSSFHPDYGRARQLYHTWKHNKLHLMSITGKPRLMDYRDSPFADVAKEHDEKITQGLRYHTGTRDTDLYYIKKMRQKIQTYTIQTGEREPIRKPHPRYDPTLRKPKRKWYDSILEQFK